MITNIGIAYFVCGFIYLIACIMDGQDLKPLWKKWLGLKLADIADLYYPIDYCIMPKCKYYNGLKKAKKEIKGLRNDLSVTKRELVRLKLDRIDRQYATFDSVRIESEPYIITEDEVFRAYRNEEQARNRGYSHLLPPWETIEGLKACTKERIIKNIYETIKRNEFVNIDIDTESRYPAIIMRGWLYVGRKKNESNGV